MAGLLGDVLPFIYSQSDRLKRHLGGLLSDPMGSLEQTAGGLMDSHRTQQGLLSQAMSDPKRPFHVTDKNAMQQAAMNMLTGPLGIAPAGMTAWHGSPHVFDKFDSSKIGTGEGAQAYGHGLYLAERKGTAQEYADQLGTAVYRGNKLVQGKGADSAGRAYKSNEYSANEDTNDFLTMHLGDTKAARKSLLDTIRDMRTSNAPEAVKDYQKALAELRNVRGDVTVQNQGALYQVDLPDTAVAKMLDWDKPLSQQPGLEALVNRVAAERAAGEKYRSLRVSDIKSDSQGLPVSPMSGGAAHQFLASPRYGMTQNQVAEQLRQAGIPGIRYLDGGSRGAGQGSSNFVVFPGEENILKILERNGRPLP